MGDPYTRKSAALNRLRGQLRKKRESLADQFEFKMYIIFHFKDKKKNSAVFEVAEVVSVMTNNYEESILKGAKEEAYSYESSKELLEKDVVQLHAPRWQPMRRVCLKPVNADLFLPQTFYEILRAERFKKSKSLTISIGKDILGCTTDMDYFLWPRKDIDRIECQVFSRWKGDSAAFRPIVCNFIFTHLDYEQQLVRLSGGKEKAGLIINNPQQTVFLFVDRHVKNTPPKNRTVLFKLSSICLYIPQDQLMSWGVGSVDDLLEASSCAEQS